MDGSCIVKLVSKGLVSEFGLGLGLGFRAVGRCVDGPSQLSFKTVRKEPLFRRIDLHIDSPCNIYWKRSLCTSSVFY